MNQNSLGKALRKIKQETDDDFCEQWKPYLSIFSESPKAQQTLKEIRGAKDADVIADHLATVMYFLVFQGLGWNPEIIRSGPKQPKAPDLEISRNQQTAVVEVKRTRDKSRPSIGGPYMVDVNGEKRRAEKKIEQAFPNMDASRLPWKLKMA